MSLRNVALTSTGTAKAPPSVEPSIGFIVDVAFRAMRLLGLLCGQALSAQNVLAMADRLKVGRIDTMPHPAKVVEVAILRDRPDQQFIGDTVGIQAGSSELGISAMVDVASPQPAAVRFVHVAPEAFLKTHREFGALINSGIPVTAESRVVLHAQPTRDDTVGAINNGAMSVHARSIGNHKHDCQGEILQWQ